MAKEPKDGKAVEPEKVDKPAVEKEQPKAEAPKVEKPAPAPAPRPVVLTVEQRIKILEEQMEAVAKFHQIIFKRDGARLFAIK